jgi:hypothetical protein
MTGRAAHLHPGVVDAVDWKGVGHVVDVGGAHGAFLAAVLERHPLMAGTLLDQPHVVAGADALLTRVGAADRATVVGSASASRRAAPSRPSCPAPPSARRATTSPASPSLHREERTLTYACSFDVPSPVEMYFEVKRLVGDERPKGFVAHLVFRTEDGVRHVEVFESEADWARFHDERVAPAVHQVLTAAGITEIPPLPPVEELELVDLWLGAEPG